MARSHGNTVIINDNNTSGRDITSIAYIENSLVITDGQFSHINGL